MITKALAQNGAAKVYIAGRRLEVLEAAASATGSNVIPIQCDVTSKESLAAAADRVRQESGFLNLLICNSGIGGPQVKPVADETSVEEWASANLAINFEDYTKTFAVNTSSVWFTTMTFLPLLDAGNKKGNVQQTSQVLVTSSIAAFNKKAPGGYAYGQSKAAANLAVKHLSIVLPKWKIR
jgi:NAD(P)-dependent dehydrogenase (short-subunit alcohol dehydrogenase family)